MFLNPNPRDIQKYLAVMVAELTKQMSVSLYES